VSVPLFELGHTIVVEGVMLPPAEEGLTVIVKVCDVPGQPFAVGVTVMVAVTGAVPVFVAVKEVIFPVPLAARPILVVLFVQL
jgi:hypothetical protein